MSAISAYKRARTGAGHTLAHIGELSGLQVSNLSAIESGKRVPRIDTLEKALKAAGKKFVPVQNLQASAAEIAEVIEIEIAANRTRDLFRFVAQLSNNLVAASTPEDFYALLVEPAQTTGDQGWDAVIDGVVEYRSNKRGWPSPTWTQRTVLNQEANLASSVWVGAPAGFEQLRDTFETATEFTRRGVFVALEDLESI